MARIDKGIVRRSGRMHLRSFRRSDFSDYVAMERENEAWLAPWIPTPPPDRYSRRRFVEQLRSARRGSQARTYFRFGLFDAESSGPIGVISASGIHYGSLWSCYVGYWVDHRSAGRGIAPEAVCLLFDFLFVDLSLHRAQVSIMPENAASRRVAEKLGLRDEGIARNYLRIAGEWRDHIRYAILSEEYFERKEELFRHHVLAASRDSRSDSRAATDAGASIE